jgi:hypothetical protein
MTGDFFLRKTRAADPCPSMQELHGFAGYCCVVEAFEDSLLCKYIAKTYSYNALDVWPGYCSFTLSKAKFANLSSRMELWAQLRWGIGVSH